MKRLTLILIFLGIVYLGFAQLQKGNMYLGGNINFFQDNFNKLDTASGFNEGESVNKSNYFSGTLNFGYMVRTNLALGTLFRYNYSDQSFRTNNTTSSSFWPKENTGKYNGYALGCFARKYWPLGESMFAFFVQASLSYGVGTYISRQMFLENNSGEYIYRNTSRKEDIVTFRLTPGLVYFINEHFGAECSMGNITYATTKTRYFSNEQQTGSSNGSNLRANFSVSAFYIGLNYYFGRSY